MCIRDRDDTIMIYNGNCRQLEMLKKHMKTITNNLQFTLETELNNKINLFDLTLTILIACLLYTSESAIAKI